ncbi:MAG: undecaprenyl-phosphate glucose phosphotransferase, partial [Bacteroidota bacterium]
PLSAYLIGALFVIPAWLLLFRTRGMYAPRRNVYFSDEFFAIVRVVFFGMLIVMAAAFFYRTFSFSRLVFAYLAVTSVVFLAIGRFLVMKSEQAWYRSGQDLKDVLLVGTTSSARRVFDAIAHQPSLGYRVIGYFADGSQGQMKGSGAQKLGPLSRVPSYIQQHRVDTVLISLPYQDHPRLYELVRDCEGLNTELMMVPDLLEMMTSRVRIREIQGIPFLPIKDVPITAWNAIVKRTFDVVVSVVIIVLLSPLFVVLSLLVKLSSPGPVVFRQERVGLDGSSFTVIKFRTMLADAEKETGPVWARKGDPRTTPVGRFLRRFSLDELPQLFNVLQGEMSLVGPRPERPVFVEKFRKEIPKYLDRHRVKTGMTGWAQVNGLRGNAPIEERTRYDIYYIENWSLVFDLKIILKTIRAVLFGRDAY